MKKLIAVATAATLLFGIAGATLAQSAGNKAPIQIARQDDKMGKMGKGGKMGKAAGKMGKSGKMGKAAGKMGKSGKMGKDAKGGKM